MTSAELKHRAKLQEYVENLYFTDAVEIPGLVEPQFHKSVHLEVE